VALKSEDGPLFEPIPGIHHLTEIENPEHAHQPMRIKGIVSSTSISYLIPQEVVATWIKKGKTQPDERSRTFNSFDSQLLQFVGVSEKAKNDLLAKIMDAPKNASFSICGTYTVYKVRLRPPVFSLMSREDKILDERGYEYKHFDVYIVTSRKLDLSPSTRVIITGWIRPDPKTQMATFMATDVEFPEAVEAFNAEDLNKLKGRFEGLSVRERVNWILENFDRFSHLVGRRNLAYAGLLSFFTPIWVELDGDRQHGWGISLLIGDTTTGKSETVRKLIGLLKAGTLITAETATMVGLTAAAVKAEKGEWFTDFGFLVLNDKRLLAVDGYQKLSTYASSALAEAERQGVVTKGAAAKGSAPARTRQIKIANAIDPDSGKYSTKTISGFFYPIQAVATILDKTGIARLDVAAISDQRSIEAEAVNRPMGTPHDPDLELLSEALKWAWSDQAKTVFSPDALMHILGEATRLYKKFYCDSIPLVSIDFKFKLARLSTALARLTLSSTPDLKQVMVTREHVEEVVAFLEDEYMEAGLHSLASSEILEVPTEDDLNQLIYELEAIGIEAGKTISILRFIVLKGHVTKDILKNQFTLSKHSELQPLVAILQGQDLIKSGRGFYPTSKLIQLVKIIENLGGINSDHPKAPKRPGEEQSGTIGTVGMVKKDTSEKFDVPQELVEDVCDLLERERSIGILAFLDQLGRKGYNQLQVKQYLPMMKALGLLDYDEKVVRRGP